MRLIEGLENSGYRHGPEMMLEAETLTANWLADACNYLARTNDWDLMMLQIHLPDNFHHLLLHKLWEEFPCSATCPAPTGPDGWWTGRGLRPAASPPASISSSTSYQLKWMGRSSRTS